MTSTKQSVKHIHEGEYVLDVNVTLVLDDHDWAPYLSLDDAKKLDSAKIALRQGDIKTATSLGRLYKLVPVAA